MAVEDGSTEHKMDPESKVVDSDELEASPEESAKLDRRIVLTLDLILVPVVAMFYFLAFLDRANIGNARVVCTEYFSN